MDMFGKKTRQSQRKGQNKKVVNKI